MDLFSKFKKDYLNYLISIIIPVLINAASIPLFKHLLGAEKYGSFSITFNSVLLCTAILSGWIWPSIIRYFPASPDKRSFYRRSVAVSFITQIICFLPALLMAWYLQKDFLLAVFLSLTLFITSLQFCYLAIGQSFFLSKKSIYYELIRAVCYLACALFLLLFTDVYYLYALFAATLISYLLSLFYLVRQIKKQFILVTEHNNEKRTGDIRKMLRDFISYGGPLSMWFVFASLISLVDKFFIRRAIGPEAQGNYQAMFDFLSKSITTFISPVAISLFPLLTTAYHNGKTDDIKRLLKTILGLELVVMAIVMLLYWWFGADILFRLIKTPYTTEYKLMGLIIIAGTFIWQMAIVVQKKYELKFRSNFLLGMVAITFFIELFIYVFFDRCDSQLLYPTGYALSSCIYLILVLFPLLKDFFRQLYSKL